MALPDRLPESRVPDPRAAPGLRWGVIGTGWIADRFVRALQQHTDQSVVAAAARNAERAAAFASEHRLERSYDTPEQLVSAPNVDVIYVATTHPAHLPMALLSLEAGKHTVVEKPLGINAREAAQIADTARQADVLCMEALKASAPSSIDKFPEDVALEPATVQSVELMMVRTTRCQTAVRRQSVKLHGAVSLLPMT
jgi:hypothetical protein